ncbi:hypothetical protein AND_006360 [Anopheles darlingi]|uniref:F-box domain-containing protein n=1 Tax=Anopheles darlingi TaxID=43151 RepID=W5JGE8_ANODA|nr:hypothetical protein AND_006360 [Anopheles darlingi]
MPKHHNYMDRLPDEILCMVFDRLDLESVKTASRTCQRWNAIIFFSGYVDRFQLDINVLNHATTRKQQEVPKLKRLIQRAKQIVMHTQRQYRGLSMSVEPILESQFPAFWKAIHPKITQHLRELELDFIEGSMVRIFPLIADALPSMSHLQMLNIADYTYSDMYQKSIPTLRSQSVMHLSMDCKYKFLVDMPQLQTFDGALSALHPPADNSGQSPLVFGKLKDLSVNVKGWKPTDPSSIFRRMPYLERCDWDVPLEEDLFISMGETCPLLTSIDFSKTMYLSNPSLLKSVLNLTQLRRLRFHKSIYLEEQSFLDFSKLTQLESLDLGKTIVKPSTLLNLPKSVRKLGLLIDQEAEQSLSDIITCNLSHLTELRLAYYRAPASQKLLKSLSLFEQLEVLHFSRCHFTQPFFLGMDGTLPRLHTLLFTKCKLETKHLLGLQIKFPRLKDCLFLKCFVMTESEGDEEEEEYDSDDTFESDLNSENDYPGYEYDLDSDYTDSDGYQYDDGSDFELDYDDYALLSALADLAP